MVPNQQGQPYISVSSEQFRPVGQGMAPSNVGLPGMQDLPPHYPQSMQPFPPRSNQPGHTPHIPYAQSHRPISSSAPLPGLGTPGGMITSSYTVRSIYKGLCLNFLWIIFLHLRLNIFEIFSFPNPVLASHRTMQMPCLRFHHYLRCMHPLQDSFGDLWGVRVLHLLWCLRRLSSNLQLLPLLM